MTVFHIWATVRFSDTPFEARFNRRSGSIETGTVERDALSGVTVRDDHGAVIQSLSGIPIRSWNIIGPDGTSIDSDVIPEDIERLQ
jgi:hypothetical protein